MLVANLDAVSYDPLSVDEPKKLPDALDGPSEAIVESVVDF